MVTVSGCELYNMSDVSGLCTQDNNLQSAVQRLQSVTDGDVSPTHPAGGQLDGWCSCSSTRVCYKGPLGQHHHKVLAIQKLKGMHTPG